MAIVLLSVFGLYVFWILIVLVHVRGRSKISQKNWMYRVHQYWYYEPAYVFAYGRNLILMPFWIITVAIGLLVLSFVAGCVWFFTVLYPPREKMKLIKVLDPPSQ